MERLVSFFGLLTMIGLAWLISDNRRKMNWRLIASGVGLQVLLAALLLKTPLKQVVFAVVGAVMTGFIACSDKGAEFVFGEAILVNRDRSPEEWTGHIERQLAAVTERAEQLAHAWAGGLPHVTRRRVLPNPHRGERPALRR